MLTHQCNFGDSAFELRFASSWIDIDNPTPRQHRLQHLLDRQQQSLSSLRTTTHKCTSDVIIRKHLTHAPATPTLWNRPSWDVPWSLRRKEVRASIQPRSESKWCVVEGERRVSMADTFVMDHSSWRWSANSEQTANSWGVSFTLEDQFITISRNHQISL